MTAGQFRVFAGKIRRGREVEDGTGQALRDAFAPDEAHPMEAEADDAIERCIKALNDVEFTLTEKLKAEAPKPPAT